MGEETDFSEGWAVLEDGTESAITLPYSLPRSQTVTFVKELPEVDEHLSLIIRMHYEEVNAYVDGERIYHAGTAKLFWQETTLGNSYIIIPLSSQHSGKTITIEVNPREYLTTTRLKQVALTTVAGYAMRLLKKLTPYMILCDFIFMVSIVSGITCFVILLAGMGKKVPKDDLAEDENYEETRRRLALNFFHLFCFGTVTALYIVTEYHILGLVYNQLLFSGMVCYVCISIIPALFAALMIGIFQDNRAMKILFFVSLSNYMIQLLLFFLGVIDLPQGLFITQALMVVVIINMVVIGVKAIIHTEGSRFKIAQKMVLLIAMTIFAADALVRYFRGKNWMFIVAFAMLFFVVFVLQTLMEELYKHIQRGIKGEEMRVHAYTDDLTGLKNRRAYDEEMNSLEELPPQEELIYLMMDVNGLKKANDIKGHAAGDDLLVGAAGLISEVFGKFGNCYRTGGDEFVVIAHGTRSEVEDLTRIFLSKMEKWRGRFDQILSVSIGGALQEEHMELSIDELAKLADRNMYLAKKSYYEKKGQDRRKSRS